MPSQTRKHRGYATQRLVAERLRALFPYATDAGAGRNGRDILGTPGVAIEVKARSGFSPLASMRQARENAGEDLPIVVLRMDGQGPATVGKWLAMVELDDLVALLCRAGYGDQARPADLCPFCSVGLASHCPEHGAEATA